MKKIAILTFLKANNYGALLQAYALKQTLVKLGHCAQMINYHSPKYEAKVCNLSRSGFSIRWVKQILKFPATWYRHRPFASFENKYLQDMPPVFYDTLPSLANKYDLFITGSDQVFNPHLTWNDDRYFLSFCTDKTKNASYAASFGFELNDFTDQEKTFIQHNLAQLQSLSVREQQGKEIIQTLAPERDVQVHLDPSLLLTKEDWKKVAKNRSHAQPYGLVYLLMGRDEAFIQYARKVAQEKNLRLLFITSHSTLARTMTGEYITPTVEEWVGLFLNAQCIFTNSFHGLAFSINFNKPFMVGSFNPAWPAASRLNSLLNIVGLQHRKFNSNSSSFCEEEDWEAVNKKLEQERQKAFDYLQKITQ